MLPAYVVVARYDPMADEVVLFATGVGIINQSINQLILSTVSY